MTRIYWLPFAIAATFVSLSTYSLWGQVPITGSIAGMVIAEDGSLPPGSVVVVSKAPEYRPVYRIPKLLRFQVAPSSVRSPVTVPVAADGAFRATGLPAGQYTLCARPPDGFLENCLWTGIVDVVLPPGSAATNKRVVVRRGAVIRIRLNDSQALLPAVERSYRDARARIGVMTTEGAFRAAKLRSRDAAGRDLVLTVPFDTPLRLWANINRVAIRAPDGRTVLTAGPVATFQVPRSIGSAEFRMDVLPGGAP